MLRNFKAPLAALSLGLALVGAQAARADVILQTATFTGDDPGDYTALGDGTNDGSRFIGARFSLSDPTLITNISVGIGRYGSGTFFGAIVPLTGGTAFPSVDPASLSSIALGSVLLSATDSSGNGGPAVVSGNLSLDLAAGDYAVIFGSGLFGASGYGPITEGNTPVGNYSGLFESLYDADWFNFRERGILVEVDGTPSVPEPASWMMMIAGFGAVGAAMRRRKPAVSFG